MKEKIPIHVGRLIKIALILCCFGNVALSLKAQSNQTVTLQQNAVKIADVFTQIRKQTGLIAMYDNLLLDAEKKINVNFRNTPVSQVMDQLLAGRELTWSVSGTNILIQKKSPVSGNGLSAGSMNNQQLSVRGRVTDQQGNPLPGATVILKGSGQGTTTDPDGNFNLAMVKRGATLQVSIVGYQTQSIPVNGNSLMVKLPVDVQALDETVVIAYGTTTQRFSTGNISTVKAVDIEKQPVTNPLLSLQGRVPGLFIEQATGLPGSGIKVKIQGQNSLGNGNDPLYVIDGVPYPAQLLPSLSNVLGNSGVGGINGNPLSFINPNTIESISVLKDADATAIYGSRAANGAILITTKKGINGKTKVNLNLQNGWGEVTRKLDLLNTQQYLEMRHEALKNDGISQPSSGDYDLNGLWDTSRYTDWQKELIGNTAKYTTLGLNFSGGSATTQYYIGSTYHRENTVFPGSLSDAKGSVNFNILNSSVNEKFKIQLSGSYLFDNNNLIDHDLTDYATTLSPVAPSLYSQDGSLNWMPNASGTSTWQNPLSYLEYSYNNKTKNLVSNAVLSYQLLPELNLKSSFGYTDLQSNETTLIPLAYWPPETQPYVPRIANYGTSNITSWIMEPQLNFSKQFGQSRLEILLGSTFQRNKTSGIQMLGYGFNSDLLMEDIKSAPNTSITSTNYSVYKYSAAFTRINYNLKDRYVMNLSARRDGSSRFGSENLFHNFGAVGAAWIISNEDFMKNLSQTISFLKLRGSFGTTGNDQIQDYRFMNTYGSITSDNPYQGISGLEPLGLTNPYLQWEETRKLQFGLDIGLLKDRIYLTANYFRNRSSNQLIGYSLPTQTGFGSIDRNFPATVQNTGWEIAVNSTNIAKNTFTWKTNFNITVPNSKLIAFENIESSPFESQLTVGQPITIVKVVKFLGVDPTTGVYQFADSKGNPTFTPDLNLDNTVIINTAPKYYGGIQNILCFKDIELDFLFQFVKQLGQSYAFGNYPGRNGQNQPTYVLDHWKNTGDIAPVQQFSSNDRISQNLNIARYSSDGSYSDASYLRLKNLSLSWNLVNILKWEKLLEGLRVYIQGQNLLTITNYKGMDPETRSNTSLPPLRVWTFGINATF